MHVLVVESDGKLKFYDSSKNRNSSGYCKKMVEFSKDDVCAHKKIRDFIIVERGEDHPPSILLLDDDCNVTQVDDIDEKVLESSPGTVISESEALSRSQNHEIPKQFTYSDYRPRAQIIVNDSGLFLLTCTKSSSSSILF